MRSLYPKTAGVGSRNKQEQLQKQIQENREKCMKDPNRMPTERELASSEMIEQARKRGEMHGFEGQFLDCFIEREIQLMRKWRNQSSFATIESD